MSKLNETDPKQVLKQTKNCVWEYIFVCHDLVNYLYIVYIYIFTYLRSVPSSDLPEVPQQA